MLKDQRLSVEAFEFTWHMINIRKRLSQDFTSGQNLGSKGLLLAVGSEMR